MNEVPLVTKQKPRTLDDVVGHESIIRRLKSFIKTGDLPHVLLTGPAGVGKTSVAFALANDLYGPGWRQYVLEANASDDRGIDVVRGRIKSFTRAAPIGVPFHLAILDEADNLTSDAQSALRRVMEDFASICRFVLIANYPNRIIDPIRDRCAAFHFKPLGTDDLRRIIVKANAGSGVKIGDAETALLSKRSNGSARKALNLLGQLNALARLDGGSIRSDDIETLSPSFSGEAAKEIVKAALGGKAEDAERLLVQEYRNETADGMFLGLFESINGSGLAPRAKAELLSSLGDAEYRTLVGCDPEIQLRVWLRRVALLGGKV